MGRPEMTPHSWGPMPASSIIIRCIDARDAAKSKAAGFEHFEPRKWSMRWLPEQWKDWVPQESREIVERQINDFAGYCLDDAHSLDVNAVHHAIATQIYGISGKSAALRSFGTAAVVDQIIDQTKLCIEHFNARYDEMLPLVVAAEKRAFREGAISFVRHRLGKMTRENIEVLLRDMPDWEYYYSPGEPERLVAFEIERWVERRKSA